MDRGTWWARVHGVAKSWTRLSDFTFFLSFYTHTHTHTHIVLIHSSISGHLGLSIAWLLQIVLQWTWEYRCLFKFKSFFFSDKYPQVELLDLIWTVLRRTGQVFCRLPLYWVSSDIFLMIRLMSWVYRRKTAKVKCHSHHIWSRVYSINVTYNGWGWPWPPGWGSVGQFSPLKNYSLSSFPCHPL